MKASILFITYNHSRFVAEAIRSAIAQDYADIELVVCDDASTDDTRVILEEELKNCPPHVKLLRAHSEENVGLLANYNRGIAACTGDVIIGMSGDDVSLLSRVSTVMEVFASNPRCMLVYSNWIRIDESGQILPGASRFQEDRIFSYDKSVRDIYAEGKGPGATAAIQTRVFRAFDPLELGNRPEDISNWIRALLMGEIHYLAKPLVKWRTHSENLSNYQVRKDRLETQKRILKDLLHRQNYYRQFNKDIGIAASNSFIPQTLAKQLLSTVMRHRELDRLRRYSLACHPWKHWKGAALRLIKTAPEAGTLFHILSSDFLIRASSSKRKRKWKRMLRRKQA
jgi:glycosyltransferase involved in cell wall biosynthesis